MKATAQFFPVVLYIVPYKRLTIEMIMKAIEQYFPVVLFRDTVYEGVLTYESADEIFSCGDSNKSY